MTARAVPHPREPEPSSSPESSPPSSTELALEPLNEAAETVQTGELILDSYDAVPGEETPVTGVSPWQRLSPPPLPEPPKPEGAG